VRPGYNSLAMSKPRWDDEDDWVGTPPEGHYTRDRANPGFWQNHWQEAVATALLGVVAIVALIIALAA
jgi:hypothetical protein